MKIAVSTCLLGKCCKYNGGHNRNDQLIGYLKDHEVVPVCPESAGGLPIPRPPAEMVGDKILNREGLDVTAEFVRGADICMEKAAGCDCAVLQPRSPSCGVKRIYDGTFTGALVPGSGVFARRLQEAGIPAYDADEYLENLGIAAPEQK